MAYLPVPGFPQYHIGSDGTVLSFARNKSRQLKPILNSDGYLTVSLYRNGKDRRITVHQIVLMAFVGPRPEGMECRHLDGVKTNNNLSNLAWGSPRQNAEDKRRHGRSPIGSANGRAKLTEADAREVVRLYHSDFPDRAALARRFRVSWAAINRILRGTRWTHALAVRASPALDRWGDPPAD